MKAIVTIENLTISFTNLYGKSYAVRNLSLSIPQGKTLGLVGESGCGKSVTAYSILNLVPKPGTIESGTITYNSIDLLRCPDSTLRSIRGKNISMIFQEPMTSLNPVFTIGYQVQEAVEVHLHYKNKEAKEYTIELLGKAGIPNPSQRYYAYPHQLSGGLRQRAMIAMALAAHPDLLIADEPTTALDVTIQSQILDLLMTLQSTEHMSMLLITHDLGIVANTADYIAIMYAGEIVEMALTKEIFENPLHPYTHGLMNCIPSLRKTAKRLYTIPGNVPLITQPPQGCVFHPRCYLGDSECLQNPVILEEKTKGHFVRCIKCKGR
ncbi:MAG: ABC transporter ATP-binding protein [Spirochaetes bacterium]|nr:ABC transporter ATP-binding protein [Spirochaetota bacterium]